MLFLSGSRLDFCVLLASQELLQNSWKLFNPLQSCSRNRRQLNLNAFQTSLVGSQKEIHCRSWGSYACYMLVRAFPCTSYFAVPSQRIGGGKGKEKSAL